MILSEKMELAHVMQRDCLIIMGKLFREADAVIQYVNYKTYIVVLYLK